MNLNELISKYLQGGSSFVKVDALSYISRLQTNTKLPEDITDFIHKFANQKHISKDESSNFSEQVSKLDIEVQKCIFHLLYMLSDNIYLTHANEIKDSINLIDSNLKEGKEIPQSTEIENEKYIGLLNCYQLFANHRLNYKESTSSEYPGLSFKRV